MTVMCGIQSDGCASGNFAKMPVTKQPSLHERLVVTFRKLNIDEVLNMLDDSPARLCRLTGVPASLRCHLGVATPATKDLIASLI